MQDRGRSNSSTVPRLDQAVRADIDRAGYYPELVADALAGVIGGSPVLSHLVHQETTFDGEEVRRHITVLALTSTTLVVGHTDDFHENHAAATGGPVATTSTEAVPVGRVHSVIVTRVIPDPEHYVAGRMPSELTLTLGWGAVRRIDLEPAGCSDPDCEADHGYSGTASADDLSLRISEAAEGPDAVRRALAFAATLSAATAP